MNIIKKAISEAAGFILTCVIICCVALIVSRYWHRDRPAWFCLGGMQYFETSENPIYDKYGNQRECDEADE
jgi:hypothetical protein